MAKDNIRLTLSAKDLASGTIHKVRVSTIALGTAIGNLSAKLVTGAINGIRGWINEALEAEKANVMVGAALRGVGAYTPELEKQFLNLASAIQDETGASDEAVKANIAMLTTMGVATDKMGQAARAVQALASLGRDGAQAMVAVARALEGDISGFERLAPKVRAATTLAEKYEAANQLIAAGYEQQKASLQTVGGAWSALSGRLGDAREAIIGAVFEGTKIGTTFNDAQAAVGKFLASDSFQNFTNALRDGSAYAKDILKSLTSGGGGFGETAGAIGGVILAALKDGAVYVAGAIKDALGSTKTGKVAGWLGRRVDDLGAGSRVIGALSAGASMSDAAKQIDIKNDGPRESALDAATAKLNAVLERRARSEIRAADAAEAVADATGPNDGDLAAGLAIAKEKEIEGIRGKIADIEEQRAQANDISIINDRIQDAADAEAKAREALAKAEADRKNAVEKNINDWIGDKKKERDDEKQNARDLKKPPAKLQSWNVARTQAASCRVVIRSGLLTLMLTVRLPLAVPPVPLPPPSDSLNSSVICYSRE